MRENMTIEEINETTSDLDNMGETTAQEILRKTKGYSETTIKANELKESTEQDYENEMTTFIFDDDSRLECCGIDYNCIAK